MEVVVSRGLSQATVEMVVQRAEVGRAAFDLEFTDLRDCCLKVYLANIEDFERVVFDAADARSSWRDRLRAAAYAAAHYIQARPIQTRFDMVQMLSVGELAQAHRDRLFERLVDLIDEGRLQLDDPEGMSRDVAIMIFGSIYQFLLKELHDNPALGTVEASPDLESFVPEMMYIAVRPYLGHETASEELYLRPGAETGV